MANFHGPNNLLNADDIPGIYNPFYIPVEQTSMENLLLNSFNSYYCPKSLACKFKSLGNCNEEQKVIG